MARVTYGGIITSINGSIGGTTFQKNRAGNIVRLRPIQKATSTLKQGVAHSKFSNLAVEWKKLSMADKILWNDYGVANPKIDKFGNTKILTGYNYFLSLNFWRVQLALSVLTVPPPFVIPAPVTDFVVNLTPTQILQESVTAPIAPNLKYIQYTSPPIYRTTKANFNQMRLSGISSENPPFPKDNTAGWNFIHGLDYAMLNATSTFYIGFGLIALDINSGLTSVGLFKTYST